MPDHTAASPHETWLEHVDLKDGEWADLLLRYPYDRTLLIEQATERDEAVTQMLADLAMAGVTAKGATTSGWMDAVLRASLWKASLKHDLTGLPLDETEFGMASQQKIGKLRLLAVKNYVEWFKDAKSGPKDSSGTDNPTPNGEASPGETPESD